MQTTLLERVKFDRDVSSLSNDELNLLWFRLDKYLDDESLTDIYSEMARRGMRTSWVAGIFGFRR